MEGGTSATARTLTWRMGLRRGRKKGIGLNHMGVMSEPLEAWSGTGEPWSKGESNGLCYFVHGKTAWGLLAEGRGAGLRLRSISWEANPKLRNLDEWLMMESSASSVPGAVRVSESVIRVTPIPSQQSHCSPCLTANQSSAGGRYACSPAGTCASSIGRHQQPRSPPLDSDSGDFPLAGLAKS